MRRLFILRPEPGASESVRRARDKGLDAEATPLFRIEPVEWQTPEAAAFDGLLLTSANAVRCGGTGLQRLRGLPVYAVGEATAEAAREAGFDVAASGGEGVDRLLASIEPGLKLLHLAGEDRREPKDAAQAITAVPVYRSVPIDAELGGLAGAVAALHSPRAAERLGALVAPGERGSIRIAAISPTAADAAGRGWEMVRHSRRPTDSALLALAARLCDKAGE